MGSDGGEEGSPQERSPPHSSVQMGKGHILCQRYVGTNIPWRCQ